MTQVISLNKKTGVGIVQNAFFSYPTPVFEIKKRKTYPCSHKAMGDIV